MIPTVSYFSLLEPSSSICWHTNANLFKPGIQREIYLHVKWQVYFFALLFLIKHTEPGWKFSEFSPILKRFDHNDLKC